MPDESSESFEPKKEQPSETIKIPPIPKPAAGAATGAILGSVAGPIGAVVGGVAGAIAGKAAATGKPISTTAREVVGIPRTVRTKRRGKVPSHLDDGVFKYLRHPRFIGQAKLRGIRDQ